MERRESFTVRFPEGLLSRMRKLQSDGESLNDLIVEATKRELRRREALQAHQQIVELRKKIRVRTGTHPDPAPLIRALREGAARDA